MPHKLAKKGSVSMALHLTQRIISKFDLAYVWFQICTSQNRVWFIQTWFDYKLLCLASDFGTDFSPKINHTWKLNF